MPEIKNAPDKGRFKHQPESYYCADGCDFTAVQRDKPVPKKHRARLYMLRSGVNGFTENEILRYCHLSSGRNYATELERQLNFILERIDEPNGDGIGSHYRYRFASRKDVISVIELVNRNSILNGHQPLTQCEINEILTLYPDTTSGD
ncbi:hypothetical protein LU604_03450 [Erwinia tracheiphila]|uniref:Uncharacterized protein n=1 Tax=Erwinia tracheiphila TaxID=65700 RepID=A0A345CUQ7_9GAMM|nr:hypothetical protein [Erwinia tracheiphila]AXF77174.1 hypothetical protein AV903_15895 [Erwinia tracheiphila]UIA84136.1 hypothetical protein LU604_03450 [Erwinia tracheiphila]UIA92717.1 hypothetical protein LU632_03415 [Erwinia tracheiphila]